MENKIKCMQVIIRIMFSNNYLSKRNNETGIASKLRN